MSAMDTSANGNIRSMALPMGWVRALPSIMVLCTTIAVAQTGSVDQLYAPSELQFDTLKPGSGLRDWRRAYFPRDFGSDTGFAYSSGTQDDGAYRSGETTAGYVLPLSSGWSSLFESTYLPNANGLSEWSMLGQVGTPLGAGWGLEAGVRRSELSLSGTDVHRADAKLGMVTVAKMWDNYRSQYTLYKAWRDNGVATSGHRVALNYLYGGNNSFGVTYDRSWAADNPLASPLGNSGIVSNLGVVGEHWLTKSWSVNYDALFQPGTIQGLRPELRIGFKLAF